MSMPEFPQPPDFTQEQALNMILSSIALEEVALSHIINAEGEKIQCVLGGHGQQGCSATSEEVLAVNKSVTCLLETVMQTQLLLKSKMEKVLEYLPRPPTPPVPPHPPCPPLDPGCRPCGIPDCSGKHHMSSACFEALPGTYCYGDALIWCANSPAGCGFAVCASDPSKIVLPAVGCLSVHFTVEMILPMQNTQMAWMELQIASQNQLISHSFCTPSHQSCVQLSGSTAIVLQDRACQQTAGIFLRSPRQAQIKKAQITFSQM